MSEGEGFARRVTLANLDSFAPLLKSKTAAGLKGEIENRQSTDAANQNPAEYPDLLAAEALFSGESIKTGIRFTRPSRANAGAAGGKAKGKAKGKARRGLGNGHATNSGAEDMLLMRVRPRRNGKQLQISMIVHNSSFMQAATEVVSAADGSSRKVGYDYTKRAGVRAKNLARFEAPEMGGMLNPVARFRWVDVDDGKGGTERILKYEVFDADHSSQGRLLLKKLEDGIATPPTIQLNQLSRDETVLSKSVRENAQWYRLESVGK